MNPLDLVSAASWTRVAFTTYSLSLAFFEAVILDALVRGGGRSAIVFADPEGVRAGLSEQGAHRVGRDYAIIPVAKKAPGVFHPKIGIFGQKDDAHLLVGSGNLTFGGWGGNLEKVEHLHPSFAADAFNDAAGFFEGLANSGQVVTTAGSACEEIAALMRRSARQGPRNGNIHLLHSFDGPIAEHLALYADELGGATRVTAVSPYYDISGAGLSRLSGELTCEDIRLHAHGGGTVWSRQNNGWPFEASTPWQAVQLTRGLGTDDRRLHAKVVEVVCRRGRLLLSGSANITEAGLFGDNVEACVLRVQRDTKAQWKTKPASAPKRPVSHMPTDVLEAPQVGILSAALSAGTIQGRVLAPQHSGAASASIRSPRTSASIGKLIVDQNGHFSLCGGDLEVEAYQSGRLVLRLESADQAWEGFVSNDATLELIRRTGVIAPSLIAMMVGTETPADVVAILSWFHEDPSRLPETKSSAGGGETENGKVASTFVTLDDLAAAALGDASTSEAVTGEQKAAWRHAIALIRAAFVQSRGPWSSSGEPDDEDTEAWQKRVASDQKDCDRSIKIFDDLLDVILDPSARGRHAIVALSLAHFLADRIAPEAGKVRVWLNRILPQIPLLEGPEVQMVTAAALLHYAALPGNRGASFARRFFLRRQSDPSGLIFDPTSIQAFVALLGPDIDLRAFHREVCSVRTVGEQIDAYCAAVEGSGPKAGFEDLKTSRLWSRLDRAFRDPRAYSKVQLLDAARESCPRCHIRLPLAAFSDLQTLGYAEASSCCGLILLNRSC